MSFIANFVCPKQYVTMVKIGTTLSPLGKKAVLCGSGELGKEVAIELQRFMAGKAATVLNRIKIHFQILDVLFRHAV